MGTAGHQAEEHIARSEERADSKVCTDPERTKSEEHTVSKVRIGTVLIGFGEVRERSNRAPC